MTANVSSATVHDVIGDALQPLGGLLRCTVCGFEQELGSLARSLDLGWPKHCGYTMRWVTQRQLDEETE